MPRGRKRLAQPPANKLSSRANQDLNPGSPASASECKERAVSWDGYSSIPEWKKREITVVRIQVTLTTVPAITKQSRVNKPDYWNTNKHSLIHIPSKEYSETLSLEEPRKVFTSSPSWSRLAYQS